MGDGFVGIGQWIAESHESLYRLVSILVLCYYCRRSGSSCSNAEVADLVLQIYDDSLGCLAAYALDILELAVIASRDDGDKLVG